jgi:hypothetical protein
VIHVAVHGDTAVEPDETLSGTLSETASATLGDASADLTLTDDEPLALAVASPEVAEGDGGTTPPTFTVALESAPPTGSTLSVDYHVVGVTASVPGDVAPPSGTLVFGPGEHEKHVTVEVQADSEDEADEAFRLALTNLAATGDRPVLRGESTIATIVDDNSSDTVAPHTTATADPPANDAGWNREDVTVTLTATDEGGLGVEQIAYRLTGAQTEEETVTGAQASAKIAAEGIPTVTYRAADNAGNAEPERTLVIRLDKTAPTVSCTASPHQLWPPNHTLIPVTVAVDVADGTRAPTTSYSGR